MEIDLNRTRLGRGLEGRRHSEIGMIVAEEGEVEESQWERDVPSRDRVTHIPLKTTGDLIYTDLRGTGQGNVFPFSPTLSPSSERNCIMGAKETEPPPTLCVRTHQRVASSRQVLLQRIGRK